MRPSRELLKGASEIAVLAEIAAGPTHGYELARRLRDRSGGAIHLGEGTIYPLLTRLEAAGLISGRWSTAGGRRRRVYSINQSGRKRFSSAEAQWRTLAHGMTLVLGGPAHA